MENSDNPLPDTEGLPFRVSLEAVNKAVGLVALGLPFALLGVTALGNTCPGIDSISHYYYSRLGGDILVGSLFLIGILLLFFYKCPTGSEGRVQGYMSHYQRDIWLARLAGLCAFGVALAPTAGEGCENYGGLVARLLLKDTVGGHALPAPDNAVSGSVTFDFWPTLGIDGGVLTMIHYGAALGMFLVLAYFSLDVFRRPQTTTAKDAGNDFGTRKKLRNLIYLVCGLLIVAAILALIYKFVAIGDDTARLAYWNRYDLTFWFEALGLVAFGISWSVKGRLFAWCRDRGETDPKTGRVAV